MKHEYVVATILISYLCKNSGETKQNYVRVEDCYPDLVNTHFIMNFAQSNDKYQVLETEFSLEEAHFSDIDFDLCHTLH